MFKNITNNKLKSVLNEKQCTRELHIVFISISNQKFKDEQNCKRLIFTT